MKRSMRRGLPASLFRSPTWLQSSRIPVRPSRVVEKMEEARQEGLKVGCDLHPYMAAMTHLVSLMPPWFFEGGTEERMRKLRDRGERAKIRKALLEQFGHLGRNEFWSRT